MVAENYIIMDVAGYGKAFEILNQDYVRLGAFTCETEEQVDECVATIQRYIDQMSSIEEDRKGMSHILCG